MTEEGFSLRHNPLGIHSLDGTDFVVGKSPCHVTVKKNMSETAIFSMAMKAKSAYYDEDDSITVDAEDSVPTGSIDDQLRSLGISDGAATKRVPEEEGDSSVLNDVNFDFGSDFGNDMSGVLTRKNTVTTKLIPSSVSQLVGLTYHREPTTTKSSFPIQRLKSIRKCVSTHDLRQDEDDVKRAEDLPDEVLKMIAYSTDSPWIDSAEDEEDECILGPMEPKIFNPLVAPQQSPEPIVISPSVSTLASHVSEPLERDLTPVAADPPRTVRQPTIEETDPISKEDRGRLFLQINKVNNMKGLPLDMTRNPKFTLSLDNGLQTVTTDPFSLPAPGMNGFVSAKIGQEFELTVAEDLELVLTVNVSMDALQLPAEPSLLPRPTFAKTHTARADTESAETLHSHQSTGSAAPSTSALSSPKKRSVKDFLMRSPKKLQKQRKQQQQQQQQKQKQEKLRREESKAEENRMKEQQRHHDEVRENTNKQHKMAMDEFHRNADIWRGLAGANGEYCRGYVFASHYEKDIYGVAKSYAIPLYSEWDTKTSNGVPKTVCDLQVTMFYVPKLYGSEQIPMSMYECQKELECARKKQTGNMEGFLTQQGGDCGNIWRRRYFTLTGSELVGRHEATMKRRALIHLKSVVSVKETLSEDLWCIYEDRSFQLNFDDGEAIGFYADTIEARDGWVKALRTNVANCNGQLRSWTDLVMEAGSSSGDRS